jgi:hypothetical protein
MNGGISGEFQTVEVESEGCMSSGVASYQQFSVTVLFNIEGCGLSRAAIIGIAVGASVMGVLAALVIVIIIKFSTARYTNLMNARIRGREADNLAQPLLEKL